MINENIRNLSASWAASCANQIRRKSRWPSRYRNPGDAAFGAGEVSADMRAQLRGEVGGARLLRTADGAVSGRGGAVSRRPGGRSGGAAAAGRSGAPPGSAGGSGRGP